MVLERLNQWTEEVFIPAVENDDVWPQQLGKWLSDPKLSYSRLAHGEEYFEEMDARVFSMMYAYEDVSGLLVELYRIYYVCKDWNHQQTLAFWQKFVVRLGDALALWKAVIAEPDDKDRALRGLLELAVAFNVGFEQLISLKDDEEFPSLFMMRLLDALSRLQTDNRLSDLWHLLLTRKTCPKFPYHAWRSWVQTEALGDADDEIIKQFNPKVCDDRRTYNFCVAEIGLRGLLLIHKQGTRRGGESYVASVAAERIGDMMHPLVKWAKNVPLTQAGILNILYECFPHRWFSYEQTPQGDAYIDHFYQSLLQYGERHGWSKRFLEMVATYVQFHVVDY